MFGILGKIITKSWFLLSALVAVYITASNGTNSKESGTIWVTVQPVGKSTAIFGQPIEIVGEATLSLPGMYHLWQADKSIRIYLQIKGSICRR
jgi:hypothetical protein